VDIDPTRVLFMGKSDTAVCYYRCLLPAMAMGADWVGLRGEPPRFIFTTGIVKNGTLSPEFSDYDIVVIQQPKGRNWKRLIRLLQEQGTTVLYEIDDYLHGIPKRPDHDFRHLFTKAVLRDHEACMRAADGLIVSTPYLGYRYAEFNERVYVCRNGLDTARYALTLPERDQTNIVWAGSTGHREGATEWLQTIALLMRDYEDVSLVTIGQAFADALEPHFPGRALSIPWTIVDIYPAAMTHGDIAIAPAPKGLWGKAKSDLRWLEASALGIPVVADPDLYPDIEHGVTGFHAHGPQEIYEQLEDLVLDPDLRLQVGAKAREWVRQERSMGKMVDQWRHALHDARHAGQLAAPGQQPAA
jgi:glycosyltransferase involved in cell wall biosynthesis